MSSRKWRRAVLQIRPHHCWVRTNIRGPAVWQGVVLGPETHQTQLHRWVYRFTAEVTLNYCHYRTGMKVNWQCYSAATAIPNATVTWWFRGKEIGRSGAGAGDLDRNFNIRGHGPTTDLTITPLRSDYYGFYKCKAENPHGIAYHEIELEEAREPSRIQQVIRDKTTATTIQFRFVPPTDTGGLPVDAYAVEYKDTRKDWISAKRRVWPASKFGVSELFSNSKFLFKEIFLTAATSWRTWFPKGLTIWGSAPRTELDSPTGASSRR